MTPAARYNAAIDVLNGFLAGEPVEKTLSNWARRNRYAGSKDRAAVRDIVFDCLRNLRSFQHNAGFDGARGLAVGHCLAYNTPLGTVFNGEGYAPHPLTEEEPAQGDMAAASDAVRYDIPEWLVAPLQAALGDDFTQTCQVLQNRAPVDLRVNLRKGDRATAQELLAQDDILTEPVDFCATALRVLDNPRRVARSKPYLAGQVELQDAASQAVVAQLPLNDGPRVLDYCAGGGGKTLAMAALAPNARISAYDQSQARLEPLRDRAKRAGAPVRLLKQHPQATDGVFDLVVLDVPCSGSGSWRRNPEAKWRLTAESLQELNKVQLEILTTASALVAVNGTLALITCSILAEENEQLCEEFLAAAPDWQLTKQRRFSLLDGGDGFFLALFQKEIST